MTPLLAEATTEGWRYAGWIALDLRLIIFVAAVSGLIAIGSAALWVRSGRPRDYLSVFFLTWLLAVVVLTLIFNSIAAHPVFIVEKLFPFP